MESWGRRAMSPWDHVTLRLWGHGALGPRDHGTMGPWTGNQRPGISNQGPKTRGQGARSLGVVLDTNSFLGPKLSWAPTGS